MSRSTSLAATTLAIALGLSGCSAGSTDAPAAAPAATTGTATAAPSTEAEASTDATAPVGTTAIAPELAVQVGGEPELDPCMSARVRGDGPHPVLAGPDETKPQLAMLAAGQIVHICDPGPASWYTGIVWSEDESVDCGLSSPIAVRAAYAGACHSGWISLGALDALAG